MMATVTQPTTHAAATTTARQTTQDGALLDQVIRESERGKTVRGQASAFLCIPEAKIYDVLRNVWKPPKGQEPFTDRELFTGMVLVGKYGLDPFAREIYVTRGKDGLMIVIGIDGWIKVLDRTEGYDGFEQDLHWSDDGKLLEYVETRIFSTKRSRPTVYRGYAQEYGRLGGFMLGKIPWHMLRLFSLRHAARLFTPIGASVVTEEEARWMDAYATPTETSVDQQTKAARLAKMLADRQAKSAPTADAGMEADPPYNPPTAAEIAEHSQREPEAVNGTDEASQAPVVKQANTSSGYSQDEAEVYAEWTDAIRQADTVLDVQVVEDRANELPAAIRSRFVEFCLNRKAELRGKRGERSNRNAGKQQTAFDAGGQSATEAGY